MIHDGEFIVLRPAATHEQFRAFASAQGMTRLRFVSGDGVRALYEDVWQSPDHLTFLYDVIDPNPQCHFIWALGRECDALGAMVRATFASYEVDELIEAATCAKEHNRRVSALYWTAVACPRFDPMAFNAFLIGVMDPSALLRMASLSALRYRSWPEAGRVFLTLSESDPDEQVCALARGFYEQHTAEIR